MRLIAAFAVLSAAALTVVYLVKFWTARSGEFDMAPCPEDGCTAGSFVDFRDATWLPVKWFLAGNDPYDTVTYLVDHPYAQDFPTYAPAHLALWSALGGLSWDGAVMVDMLINVAIVVGVGVWAGISVLRRWFGDGYFINRAMMATAGAVAVVVMWISRTVAEAASYGQPSTLYALAAAPAVFVKQPAVASALVAITCLKPQVGLFVVLILLAQRRWKVAAAGVAIAVGVSLVVVVVLADGVGGIPTWIQTVRQNVSGAAAVRTVEYLQDRLDIEGALLHSGLHPAGALAILLAVVGVVLVFAAARWGIAIGLPDTGVVLAFGIGSVVVYHIAYDAMWLIVPVVFAAVEVLRGRDLRKAMWILPGLIMLGGSAAFARWYGIDLMFGTSSTIVAMRVLLFVGIPALAAGMYAVNRFSSPTVEPVSEAVIGDSHDAAR